MNGEKAVAYFYKGEKITAYSKDYNGMPTCLKSMVCKKRDSPTYGKNKKPI